MTMIRHTSLLLLQPGETTPPFVAAIQMLEYGLLQDAGKVTTEIAKLNALAEFEKYRVIQDRLYMSDYDRFILELEGERDDSEEEPE